LVQRHRILVRTLRPPIPLPTQTPIRCRAVNPRARPGGGFLHAATRSGRAAIRVAFSACLREKRPRSEVLDLGGDPAGYFDASKWVIPPTPDLPAWMELHVSFTVCPMGFIVPIPVTTTRLPSIASSSRFSDNDSINFFCRFVLSDNPDFLCYCPIRSRK
jgi:hypothetical protein